MWHRRLHLQERYEKLEAAAPEQEKRKLEVYSVTRTQRARFDTVVAGLTEEMPDLQILNGGQPGEMIVWAKPSHHAIVDTLLSQLNRDIPTEQKATWIVVPLSKVEPQGVADILTELFPDATIRIDERSARVMVYARPEMQKTIREIIKQLDTDLPEGLEIKLMVYPIRGLNSSTVQSLITEDVPRVSVILDDGNQSLIVRGRLEDHRRAC